MKILVTGGLGYIGSHTAVELSKNISWLRANRSHWREKVLNSNLYDPANLFQCLENAFSDMANQIKSYS